MNVNEEEKHFLYDCEEMSTTAHFRLGTEI